MDERWHVITLVRRNGDFDKLTFGLWLSTLGDATLYIGVVWYVARLEPMYLPVLGMVMLIPRILTMVGGWIVDQVDLRKLMIRLDILRGVCLLGASFILTGSGTDVRTTFLAIGCLAVISLGDAMYSPATMALLPEVLKQEDLLAGNGLLTTANHLARIGGQVVGGLTVFVLPLRAVLRLDAVTFGVSAVMLMLIRLGALNRLEVGKKVLTRELLSSWTILSRVPWLKVVAPASIAINIFFSVTMIILPLFIRRAYGGSALEYSVFLSAWSGGQILGSLTVPFWKRFKLHKATSYAAFLQGACFLIVALTHTLWVGLILFAVAGYANSSSNALKNTLFIERTPQGLRGRTFGFLGGFVQIGAPVAPLVASLIIAKYPLWTAWVVTGLISLTLGAIYLIFMERPIAESDSRAAT